MNTLWGRFVIFCALGALFGCSNDTSADHDEDPTDDAVVLDLEDEATDTASETGDLQSEVGDAMVDEEDVQVEDAADETDEADSEPDDGRLEDETQSDESEDTEADETEDVTDADIGESDPDVSADLDVADLTDAVLDSDADADEVEPVDLCAPSGGGETIYSFVSDWCTEDDWCIEQPIPSGQLWDVWAAVTDDVWMVGSGGIVYRWNGETFRRAVGIDGSILSVYGFAEDDVWFVGEGGLILHWDGDDLYSVPLSTDTDFFDVWGAEARKLWFVGESGLVCRYNGTNWRTEDVGTDEDLLGVAGTAANDVWMLVDNDSEGHAGLIHHDGDSPEGFEIPGNYGVNAFWVAGVDDVWVPVGNKIQRFNSEEFSLVETDQTGSLWAVWGSAPDSIFFGGSGGTILKWTGSEFIPQEAPSGAYRGLFGLDTGEIWAVGGGGTVTSFDGDDWHSERKGFAGTFAAVWGSSDDDIWALGAYANGHQVGGAWFNVPYFDPGFVKAVHGTASDNVWAVDTNGGVHHFDSEWSGENVHSGALFGVFSLAGGQTWAVGAEGGAYVYEASSWDSIDLETTTRLQGVWASSDEDIYIVGRTGLVLHYGGESWETVDVGATRDLSAVRGRGSDDVWIAGVGHVYHYDGENWIDESEGLSGFLLDLWLDADGGVWTMSDTVVFRRGGDGVWHAEDVGGDRMAAMFGTESTMWTVGRAGGIYSRAK